MSVPVLQTPLTLPVIDAGLPFSAVIAATNDPTSFGFTPASGIAGSVGAYAGRQEADFTVLTGPLPASLGGSDSPATVTLGTITATNSDGTSAPATLTAQVRPMVATSGSPGLSGDGTDFWITGGAGKITNPRSNPDIFQGHGWDDTDFFFAVQGGDSNIYYGWINAVAGVAGENTYLNHRYYVVWATSAPPVITTGTDSAGANNTYGTVIATGTQLTPCIDDTVPDSISGQVGNPIGAMLVAADLGGMVGNEGRTFTGTVAASGLPSGLSLNGSNQITGTLTAAGTFFATISATQGGITYPRYLVINIANVSPPAITSGSSAAGTIGVAFNYQITATNSPASYAATGLPSGLSVNTSTGAISGTPTAAGVSSVTISATNAGGTGSETLNITVSPPAPVVTSASSAAGTAGVAFNYNITAINSPTSYAATGLPSGLGVNTSTGLISGTPTAIGVSEVTISATNALGTGSEELTLTIYDVPTGAPVILSGPFAALDGNAPVQAILLGGGPGVLNASTVPAPANDPSQPPLILFGPYDDTSSAGVESITLGTEIAEPPSGSGTGGSGSGLGGAILDPDGYFYVTPYLRFSPGSPPEEQTLQDGEWVTVTAIS
jgi:hypothetical protein